MDYQKRTLVKYARTYSYTALVLYLQTAVCPKITSLQVKVQLTCGLALLFSIRVEY